MTTRHTLIMILASLMSFSSFSAVAETTQGQVKLDNIYDRGTAMTISGPAAEKIFNELKVQEIESNGVKARKVSNGVSCDNDTPRHLFFCYIFLNKSTGQMLYPQ